MKIVTVVGARPQFIKAAPLSNLIKATSGITEILVHTGQHFSSNMSNIFLKELDLFPDYSLGINQLNHSEMTGRMMTKLHQVISKEKPDLVLLYGDTNSTLAGALVAAKLKIPIAHVEAGVRCFDMTLPEEVNRIVCDQLSKYLFCPTIQSVENLKNEGFESEIVKARSTSPKVIYSGDIMYDASLLYRKKAKKIQGARYLATIHRPHNVDDKESLQEIINVLDQLEDVVLPLHPRTKQKMKEFNISPKNIKIIDPVSYFEMMSLLSQCEMVITDSGGLPKEAFFFKKPSLVLLEKSPWPELIECQAMQLIKNKKEDILVYAESNFKVNFKKNYYGDGRSAEKILKEIREI